MASQVSPCDCNSGDIDDRKLSATTASNEVSDLTYCCSPSDINGRCLSATTASNEVSSITP